MTRTILVVDDEQNMRSLMGMILEDAGHAVLHAASTEEAIALLANPNLDVIVTDLRMPGGGGEALVAHARKERPDLPVIVVTAHGTIHSAVQSIRNGAADYLTKPFEPEQLEIVVHNALKLRDVLRENEQLRAAIGQSGGRRLLGESEPARTLMDEIQRVAPYRTNVLVSGESGTGKELIARTIHELSPRREHPWIAINCSAIPRDLMESELFGYVRGAFTGAAQNRLGRFEQARGGTLFLDEIGELDPGLQAKLLRVLQEREFSPVGSDQLRSLDVRLIAATNRDLRERVREGRFREDLLYRLEVVHLVAPPLRARREDIPLLAHAFLGELAAETGKRASGFTEDAMERLRRHDWPGNVRELRNVVERALLYARGERIEASDLALVGASPRPPTGPAFAGGDLDGWLEEVERRAILEALGECDGVQVQAARRLGISERSLWHRVKKLGIRIDRRAADDRGDQTE